MLHQLRRGTRNNYRLAFCSFFNSRNNDAHALADRERFQTRLFFTRRLRLSLADIENYIWAFDALHGRVHDFAHAIDVLVVNRVPLSLANFLENDLLGKLRGNPPKNSFCNLWNLQLPADLSIGIRLASFVHGNLQSRIFNLLRQFDNCLHRKCANLPRVFVQLRAQVFLRLVVFARSHNNGVFHRTDHNLRINTLLSTESVDRVIELACHKNQFLVASG